MDECSELGVMRTSDIFGAEAARHPPKRTSPMSAMAAKVRNALSHLHAQMLVSSTRMFSDINKILWNQRDLLRDRYLYTRGNLCWLCCYTEVFLKRRFMPVIFRCLTVTRAHLAPYFFFRSCGGRTNTNRRGTTTDGIKNIKHAGSTRQNSTWRIAKIDSWHRRR